LFEPPPEQNFGRMFRVLLFRRLISKFPPFLRQLRSTSVLFHHLVPRRVVYSAICPPTPRPGLFAQPGRANSPSNSYGPLSWLCVSFMRFLIAGARWVLFSVFLRTSGQTGRRLGDALCNAAPGSGTCPAFAPHPSTRCQPFFAVGKQPLDKLRHGLILTSSMGSFLFLLRAGGRGAPSLLGFVPSQLTRGSKVLPLVSQFFRKKNLRPAPPTFQTRTARELGGSYRH